MAPICTISCPTPWPRDNPTQYWFSSKRLSYLSELHLLWYKEIDGKYLKILPLILKSY